MTNNEVKEALNDVYGYVDTDNISQLDLAKFIKLAKLQLKGMKASIDKAYNAQENKHSKLAVGLEETADRICELCGAFIGIEELLEENEEHNNDE